MEKLATMAKRYRLQIILGLMMFFILAGIIWGFIYPSPSSREQTGTNVSVPTEKAQQAENAEPTENPIDDEFPSDEEAEIDLKPTISFTQEEGVYKNTDPQVFQGIDSSHAGGLVVTSQPQGTNITIHSVGLEPGRGFSLSATSPFKVQEMPVGLYTLSATANGYLSKQQDFLVTEDEVSRLRVDMIPVTPTQ